MGKELQDAEKVAAAHITEIYTVQEWAGAMGFSCSKKFSRAFRNHFGVRPKSRLIELRVKKFLELIEENPETGSYEIAVEIGLRDEIALSKFIKRHTGKSPSIWKNGKKKK